MAEDERMPALQDLFEMQMAVARHAFSRRLHNAAYHALMSALYLARGLEGDEGLRMVRQEALGQIEWIDRNAPGYEHSTAASRRRHTQAESIFTVLGRQAAVTLDMRAQERRRRLTESGPWPDES